MNKNLPDTLQLFLNENGISAENINFFDYFQYLTPKTYAKGDMITRIGDNVSQFFLMTEGLVRCFYLHEDTEVNLRFLTDRSLVTAFSAFINHSASQEYIECLETCHGYEMPIKTIQKLRQDNIVIEKLLRISAEQHYLALERRLRMIQHKSAADRYAFFQKAMPKKIVSNMPSYHIASYLGIAPQSFSRLKRDLDIN